MIAALAMSLSSASVITQRAAAARAGHGLTGAAGIPHPPGRHRARSPAHHRTFPDIVSSTSTEASGPPSSPGSPPISITGWNFVRMFVPPIA